MPRSQNTKVSKTIGRLEASEQRSPIRPEPVVPEFVNPNIDLQVVLSDDYSDATLNYLAELAGELHRKSALEQLRCAAVLAEARGRLEPGAFTEWLVEETRIPKATAYRYLALFEDFKLLAQHRDEPDVSLIWDSSLSPNAIRTGAKALRGSESPQPTSPTIQVVEAEPASEPELDKPVAEIPESVSANFDDLFAEIEDEARAEGPEPVDDLLDKQEKYREESLEIDTRDEEIKELKNKIEQLRQQTPGVKNALAELDEAVNAQRSAYAYVAYINRARDMLRGKP